MTKLQGKVIIAGEGKGPALIATQGVNFTAALTKAPNIMPWKRSTFMDPFHPWYKQDICGKVLIFPSCIGSTYTGIVLLELVRSKLRPAAFIAETADTLLVSGVVLSEVWYNKVVPVIEYPLAELAAQLKHGDTVTVNQAGEIMF